MGTKALALGHILYWTYGHCCAPVSRNTSDAHQPCGFHQVPTQTLAAAVRKGLQDQDANACVGLLCTWKPGLDCATFLRILYSLLDLSSVFSMWLTALQNTKQQDSAGWWEETLPSVWDIIIETASSYQQLQGRKMLIFVFCLAYYSPFINRFLDSLTHFPAIIVTWKASYFLSWCLYPWAEVFQFCLLANPSKMLLSVTRQNLSFLNVWKPCPNLCFLLTFIV